jgi:hypothetical protein
MDYRAGQPGSPRRRERQEEEEPELDFPGEVGGRGGQGRGRCIYSGGVARRGGRRRSERGWGRVLVATRRRGSVASRRTRPGNAGLLATAQAAAPLW